MNPVPLYLSVASVGVMLAGLVGVADTLADRRAERSVSELVVLAVPATEVPVSPDAPADRMAAIAPPAGEAEAGGAVAETDEPLPPIGHMRQPEADIPDVSDDAGAVDEPKAAQPAEATDPIPDDNGTADRAEPDPDVPAGTTPDAGDDPDAPGAPLEITPQDPAAPVDVAEASDSMEDGDPEPAVADEDRVAVLPPDTLVEDAPVEGRIVIQDGNTLWHLARAIYGSGIYYLLIFDANRDTVSSPADIWPGQVLVIPGVVPPQFVSPDQRDPIEGLEYDLPAGLAAELEAQHRSLQRRR